MAERAVLAALTGLFLAACGGGGSSAPTPPAPAQTATPPQAPATAPAPTPAPTPAPAPAPTPAPTPAPPACVPKASVKIQLFGDSTLYGYSSSEPSGRTAVYPELALQQSLDAKYGAGKVAVETRAISGTLTTNLIDGFGINLPWPQSVNADIVVINFGINDKYTDMPPAQYKANLTQIAQASPAQVLFSTPLPVWAAKYLPAYLSTSYAPEMREVATALSLPIADEGAYALSISNWQGTYAPDSAHPNSAGYQLLNDNVLAPAVFRLVSPMLCVQ